MNLTVMIIMQTKFKTRKRTQERASTLRCKVIAILETFHMDDVCIVGQCDKSSVLWLDDWRAKCGDGGHLKVWRNFLPKSKSSNECGVFQIVSVSLSIPYPTLRSNLIPSNTLIDYSATCICRWVIFHCFWCFPTAETSPWRWQWAASIMSTLTTPSNSQRWAFISCMKIISILWKWWTMTINPKQICTISIHTIWSNCQQKAQQFTSWSR